MRLLYLNHNVAWSGGTFFRAWHLARHLAARGHRVTLLTIAPRARLRLRRTTRDGVDIVETPDLLWGSARSGWDVWDTARRAGIVACGRWDVVHAFDSRPAVVLPALVARRRGAALVMDWADWWGRGGTIDERAAGARLRWAIRPVETWFEEAFRARADATTVISRALEARAVALGVDPATILNLPHGCETETLRPAARDACRREIDLPAGGVLFGFLGALLASDATLLWEAFRAVRARCPAARLVLIGRPRIAVPPDLDAIEAGFVAPDRLVAWLGACDVLLLPLRNTLASQARWPSKANDYLAAGRPIAATRVGDLVPLIVEAGAGVAPGDSSGDLASAMLEIAGDRARWGSRAEAARRLAEGPLAWPRLVDRLEAHYRDARARRQQVVN